jgi:hypothetical protein
LGLRAEATVKQSVVPLLNTDPVRVRLMATRTALAADTPRLLTRLIRLVLVIGFSSRTTGDRYPGKYSSMRRWGLLNLRAPRPL